jgi:hypothetical protein
VASLAKLNLKSIRVEMELDGPNFEGKALASLPVITFNSPTTDDARIIEEALKRTEAALLQPVG